LKPYLSLKDIQPAYGECFELSGIELIAENLADHDLEHLDMSGTSLMEIPISFLKKLKNLRALRFGLKYSFYFRCSSGDLYSRFETFASLRQCGIRNFNEDESDELIRIRFDLISTWLLKKPDNVLTPKVSQSCEMPILKKICSPSLRKFFK